jgi:four helix bundle protein
MEVPTALAKNARMRPENMRVYQVARELGKLIDELVAKLRPRFKRLADHMERSMESAGLNLAEGLTAFRPGIKANAFEIARKETGEVRKAVQRAFDLKAVSPQEMEKPMQLSDVFIGMLTVMIKQQEQRRAEEPAP